MNFNSLCEGQRGHNTGRKGLLRAKRDKTRPFRTKGRKEHLFGSVFFPERAWSLAWNTRIVSDFYGLWTFHDMNDWFAFAFMSFIYISRRLACFVTLLKTLFRWWWWWNTWKVSSLFTACIHCRYFFPQFFSVQRKDTTLRCGVFWCFWLSFCVKLTSMDY